MPITSPTVSQFKTFLKNNSSLIAALIAARVFAIVERERVNAYILPIFATYEFFVRPEWQEGEPERITNPERLYLTDQEELCKKYYAECADAHAAHGWTGERDYCPALVAEHEVIKLENQLLKSGGKFFGLETKDGGFIVYKTEDRKKFLDILVEAALAK